MSKGFPEPWRDRAPKQNPHVRCCWVCGRIGGQGFTHAVFFAGYRRQVDEIGYAHNVCMAKALKEARNRREQT